MSAIIGTAYSHGDEVRSPSKLACPDACDIPAGLRLVQIVEPGTAFSMRCPNEGCGLAIRVVEDSRAVTQ